MREENFYKSISVRAQVIAGKDVGVKYTNQACTSQDGPIEVFAGDPECPRYQKKAKAAAGHEALHKRFSDMSHDAMSAFGIPFGGHILNSIEDARIENEGGKTFSGLKKDLMDGYSVLIDEGYWKVPDINSKKDVKAPQAFASWILFHVRGEWAQQEIFQPHLDASTEILLKSMPLAVFAPIKAMLDKQLPLLKSSRDANVLTHDIIELLKKLKEDEEDKQQQQKQQEQDQPSNGNGSGQADNDDSSDSNSSGCGDENGSDDSNVSANSSQATDSDDSEGSQNANSSSQSAGGDQDVIDAINEILNAGEGDIKTDTIHDALEDSLGDDAGMFTAYFPCETQLLDTKLVNHIDGQKVGVNTSALKLRMKKLFESQAKTRIRSVEDGKVLNRRVLHTIAAGNTAVFERKRKQKAVNTAFSILVDRSGSMRGNNKMTVANESSYALAKALEGIPGVSSEVSLFGSGKNQVTKPFGTFARPETFGHGAFGVTPLAENVLTCSMRLVDRKEERKILLVLTDGEPNNSRAASYAIEQARKSGVEVLGIGICHMVNPDLFDNYRVVNDVKGLPDAVFEIAKEALKL